MQEYFSFCMRTASFQNQNQNCIIFFPNLKLDLTKNLNFEIVLHAQSDSNQQVKVESNSNLNLVILNSFYYY